MRTSLLVMAIGVVAVLVLSLVPPVAADIAQPNWSVGDYWVYAVSMGPYVGGVKRLDVIATETIAVNAVLYDCYRLAVSYRLTSAGSRPIYTNQTGSAWYRTSDLALVREVLTGAQESPGSVPAAYNTTVAFDPPQSIQWPLTTWAAWYESGMRYESLAYGGSPPDWTNTSIVQWFGVLPDESETVPAGTFVTAPLQGTWGAIYQNLTWWSDVVGNAVASVDRISGSETRSSGLIAYQHRMGVPDTTSPTISAVTATPRIQIGYNPVSVSATIVDDVEVAGAAINFTLPDGTHYSDAMTKGSGNEYTYLMSPRGMVGGFAFTVWAVDTSGNGASAPGSFRALSSDNVPPAVSNVAAAPSTQDVGGSVTISATITDDVGISEATVNITRPDGTTANVTMKLRSGNTYTFTGNWSGAGTYSFTVWAVDAGGNAASRTGSFAIGSSGGARLAGPINPILILVIGLIIAAVAASAVLIRRKRRKGGEKAGEAGTAPR